MSLTPYRVQPYDRWDTIAAKAYGDPALWPSITAANPSLALTAHPTPGILVWVPVIAGTAVQPTTGLPPWKV